MVIPNYVDVTVVSGRNLKAGLNSQIDGHVVMSLGDTKVQTSVKKKATTPIWNEHYQFKIPTRKTSVLVLSLYNRGILSDEFLGQIRFPVDQLPDSDRGNKFYPLKGKNTKKEDVKYRGELEINVHISAQPIYPALALTKDKKGSMSASMSSHTIGSIVRKSSIGLRDHAHSVESLDNFDSTAKPEKKDSKIRFRKKQSCVADFNSNRRISLPAISQANRGKSVENDLHAIGEQKESMGSNCSLPTTPNYNTTNNENQAIFQFRDEVLPTQAHMSRRYKGSISAINNINNTRENEDKEIQRDETYVPYRGSQALGVVNVDLIYETLSKSELVDIIRQQRLQISRQQLRMRDLEDYIDEILIRVLNQAPLLLQS